MILFLLFVEKILYFQIEFGDFKETLVVGGEIFMSFSNIVFFQGFSNYFF